MSLPGGAVVGTLPFNAGDVGLIPDWGASIPHASQLKQQTRNRNNSVTNEIKTWKKKYW